MNKKEIELRLKKFLNPINNSFGNRTFFSKKYRSISKIDKMVLERCKKYKAEIDFIQSKYKIITIDFETFEMVNMAIGCLGNKASSFGTSYRCVHDKNCHPKLRKRLEELGPIGSINYKLTSNVIGKCAEVKAANYVLKYEKELEIKNLNFTPARRPRTLQKHGPCPNCQHTFELSK